MLDMLGNFGQKFSIWFGQAAPGGAVPAADPERRQWARFPSRTQTSFAAAVGAAADRTAAQVADISQGGIRLLVDKAWEPGSLLHLTLPAAARADVLLACVVHAEPAENVNAWSLGCSFIRELNSREMQAFL